MLPGMQVRYTLQLNSFFALLLILVGVASQMLHERLWTFLLASSDRLSCVDKLSTAEKLGCVARPSGKAEWQD